MVTSSILRATSAFVGVLVLFALLSPAVATEPTSATVAAEESAVGEVARGLIVRTSAEDAVLQDSVEAVLEDDVRVESPAQLTDTITVVDFAEPIPAADAAQAAADVAQRRDVEWAVPNRRVRAAAAPPVRPNDPRFADQVQLWDAGARSPGGFSSKAPSAWRATLGQEVVVAVVDTGVRPDHPDLRDQLVPGFDVIGADQDAKGQSLPVGHPHRFYTANDGDGRDLDPTDPGDWVPVGDTYCYGVRNPSLDPSSWHGTHVAGIVAARHDDAYGIAGVAPAARVQPVRVLGRCGGWDSDILAGITWASGGTVAGAPVNETPAQVVNLSLGALMPSLSAASQQCTAYGSVFRDATARGSVVVVSAGNELADARLSVPATCSGAISVAATNRAGRAAWYTNRGSSVDVSVYGGDSQVEKRSVLSAVDTGTTRPAGPGHAQYEGTSMAAPAVSGAAALLLARGVPTRDVETALRSLVQPFPSRSAAAAKQRIRGLDGRATTIDTNCTTSRCGAGVLDLGRLPAAIGDARLAGEAVVGEELTPHWITLVGTRVEWLRDGRPIAGESGTRYLVRREDVGTRIAARVTPTAPSLATFTAVTAESDVVPDGPDVSLSVVAGTRYGSPVDLRAVVARAEQPVPGESVVLRSGATVLARSTTDAAGAARFRVPARTLAAGTHVLRAASVGDVEPPATGRRSVTISKAVPTITQKVATRVSRTKRTKLTVTVKATGVPHPTGTVTVYDGRRRIASATLSASGGGTRTITLPRLAKGTHRITTVYSGSSNIERRSTSVRTVRSV